MAFFKKIGKSLNPKNIRSAISKTVNEPQRTATGGKLGPPIKKKTTARFQKQSYSAFGLQNPVAQAVGLPVQQKAEPKKRRKRRKRR